MLASSSSFSLSSLSMFLLNSIASADSGLSPALPLYFAIALNISNLNLGSVVLASVSSRSALTASSRLTSSL